MRWWRAHTQTTHRVARRRLKGMSQKTRVTWDWSRPSLDLPPKPSERITRLTHHEPRRTHDTTYPPQNAPTTVDADKLLAAMPQPDPAACKPPHLRPADRGECNVPDLPLASDSVKHIHKINAYPSVQRRCAIASSHNGRYSSRQGMYIHSLPC